MAQIDYSATPNRADLGELSSTAGSVSLDPTFTAVGGNSWLLSAGGTVNIRPNDKGLASAGNGHITGFHVAWDDTVPGVGEQYDFWRWATLDPFGHLSLSVEENGDITMRDDAGAVQGTWAIGGLTADQFYFFEFYYEVAGGTSGVLGPLYVDGVQRIAQVTGLDTLDAAGESQDRFLHNTFGTPPPQNLYWLGSYYHVSGASGIADRLGPNFFNTPPIKGVTPGPGVVLPGAGGVGGKGVSG